MTTSITANNVYDFRGLSTDILPIGSNCSNGNVDFPIQNGSSFFCMDTATVKMLKLVSETSAEGITTYTGEWLTV